MPEHIFRNGKKPKIYGVKTHVWSAAFEIFIYIYFDVFDVMCFDLIYNRSTIMEVNIFGKELLWNC